MFVVDDGNDWDGIPLTSCQVNLTQRHETPGSETPESISHRTASSRGVMSASAPLAPKSPRVSHTGVPHKLKNTELREFSSF